MRKILLPNPKSVLISLFFIFIIFLLFLGKGSKNLLAKPMETGKLIFNVKEGEHWNHSFRVMLVVKVKNQPQMAFWLEDSSGNYLATIYVTHRTATQDWRPSPGEKKEEIRRPSALPVWVHQHQNGGIMSKTACSNCHDLFNMKEKNIDFNSSIAAITGATPKAGFSEEWNIPSDLKEGTYVIKAEINHSKDFNKYYKEKVAETDSLYSGGKMGSGQPSVVWVGKIKIGNVESSTMLKIIGHGHPAGKNGTIYPDLGNLDTALEIIESIYIKYKPSK